MPATLRTPRMAALTPATPRLLFDTIREGLSLRPVGYWPLNETAGTTATDYSGFGRNGTYTGTGFTLANRVAADGVNYVSLGDGGNAGYIVLADNDAWTIGTNSGLTLFALVKPDSVAGTTAQYIITKGTTAQFEYAFNGNQTVAGQLAMFTWNITGSTIRSARFDSVLTTSWQAVAVVVEAPVTTTSKMSLLRNGAGLNATLAGTSNTPANGTAQLWLGWRGDSPAGQFWDGGLAHCAIFPGQLLAADYVKLMLAARQVTG